VTVTGVQTCALPICQSLFDAGPDVVVAVVATFVARTNTGLQPLVATAGTRR